VLLHIESLFDQVRHSRQPPLAGEPINGLEEALQVFEALAAFDPQQILGSRLARPVPSSGDQRRVLGDVFLMDERETRLPHELLVDRRRHEHEQPDRAAQRQFVVGHRTGQHDRIGEQCAATIAKHAMPVAKHRQAVCSSAAVPLFWPMSTPNVSFRMASSTGALKWR
jgi:hypothetical protein